MACANSARFTLEPPTVTPYLPAVVAAVTSASLLALLPLPSLTQVTQWGTAIVVLGGATGVVSQVLVWAYKRGSSALADHRQQQAARRTAEEQRIRDVARAEYAALQDAATARLREEHRQERDALVEMMTKLREAVGETVGETNQVWHQHSQDDAKNFEGIGGRLDGFDGRLDTLDGRLDTLEEGQRTLIQMMRNWGSLETRGRS